MIYGFEKRLNAVAKAGESLLRGGLKGVEKESLRISDCGDLSQQPHPAALGSALTNRYITTDFSEALLEFVTPAFETTWEALNCLCTIHQFTYAGIDDEMLWVASMPCMIPPDEQIPLAHYGNSNVGRMKTIYRRGLGHRYGRQMQTIAGVHFNYSLPKHFWGPYQAILGERGGEREFRSDQYLAMVRNVHRMGWILLYLFGASPAICKSFIAGAAEHLESMNDVTSYAPFGTSLRMSDLGYNNQNQSRINISLNSLDDYVRDLSRAIETPVADYLDIGVKVDGEYQQLNANLLQIENEYYSSVRPKRVAKTGERPTAALQRGGIEYVEVRSLDLSLFDPCGINQNTMRFVEAFLIYCLLQDSPLLSTEELVEISRNQTETAKRGRDPEFRLRRHGKNVAVKEWGLEILQGVAAVADEIDKSDDSSSYLDAVNLMQGLIDDPDTTPSARVVTELQSQNIGFSRFALMMSTHHKDYFASLVPPDSQLMTQLGIEADASLQRQDDIETDDALTLDEYLDAYFSKAG